MGKLVGARLVQLVALLFVISTVLFFLLRLAGDPATVLAGENSDVATLERIREQYGLDRPVVVQYLVFLGNVLRGDFGDSLASAQPALDLVMSRLGATLSLALIAIALNVLIAVPLGAWLGARPDAVSRRAVNALVFVGQGVPAYITGLILVQVFAVELGWFPSVGQTDWTSWILPSCTLAAFLVPKLVRVVSASVGEAMREDYIRTARANGASRFDLMRRHALPNALLATTALIGTQFAYLLSGALVTEVIFAWPGLGRLLVDSVTTLDFPVVQASVFVVALLVFLVNTLTDAVFRFVDPRLRKQRA